VEESSMNCSGRATPQHDFRRRYGDALADLVDAHAATNSPPASRSASPAVKAALQAIVADPGCADLPNLDALTRALLMEPAWRRLRVPSLDRLTREQLAESAQYALDHFPSPGRAASARGATTMTLALLAAAATWHAPRRHRLVREALSLAFQVDRRRATAIIRNAHRELHARA
jgi:hypothetical protein